MRASHHCGCPATATLVRVRPAGHVAFERAATYVRQPTRAGAPVVKLSALLLDEKERKPVGIVIFEQAAGADAPTRVHVRLTGLPPGAHGLHVHEFGDISDGCMTAGAHWNPDGSVHGGRNDPPHRRHVGDLGNVVADESGNVDEEFVIGDMPLMGSRGILGRALVLHYGQDDLGKGGHADSLTTGNSGGRMACAVIGVAKTPST